MEFKFSLDFGRKKSASTPTAAPEIWGDSVFYPINFSNQNNQALISMYNDLPEVQAPVNFIIDSLSNIDYSHFRGDNEVVDSKIVAVLDNPNQYQTENDFIKMFFLNRIMLGAGYINRIKPVGFRSVKQLYVLPTQKTEPILEDTTEKDLRLNSIAGYKTTFGNKEIFIPETEVASQLETSLVDNNYYCFRSRLMSAIMASDTLRGNYEARLKMFYDRGAVGIISPTDQGSTLQPEEAQQMREKYHQENGITGKKFPYLISPRSLSVQGTSFNSDELQLTENQQRDMSVVCNVLGIDPAIFGIGNNTYNNKKLAKTAFYEDVAMPYFNNYLQLLSKDVFQLPKNEKLVADYSQISAMQEDYNNIVDANSTLWNDDVITEAEYRNGAGFEGGEDKKKSELSGDVNQANE